MCSGLSWGGDSDRNTRVIYCNTIRVNKETENLQRSLQLSLSLVRFICLVHANEHPTPSLRRASRQSELIDLERTSQQS